MTVSLKDENENVIYSTEISKLDEPIKVTDVAINSCSTLKVEATTANENFDTYNSLTPNWYYKVLR